MRPPVEIASSSGWAWKQTRVAISGGGVECFDVDCDVDHVAHNHAATVEFVVPADPEVLSVDSGGSAETGASDRPFVFAVFPERCVPATKISNVEDNGLGDSADGEFSGEFQMVLALVGDLAGFERDLGMGFDVEEVGGAKMLVAVGVAAPDVGGSISMNPSTFLKWPRTLLTIMCRTLNSAAVCPGSKTHLCFDMVLFPWLVVGLELELDDSVSS